MADDSVWKCGLIDIEDFDFGECAALDSFGFKIEIENGLVCLMHHNEDTLCEWMQKFGEDDFEMFYAT